MIDNLQIISKNHMLCSRNAVVLMKMIKTNYRVGDIFLHKYLALVRIFGYGFPGKPMGIWYSKLWLCFSIF